MFPRKLVRCERFSFEGHVAEDIGPFLRDVGLVPARDNILRRIFPGMIPPKQEYLGKGVRVSFGLDKGYTIVVVEARDDIIASPATRALERYIESGKYLGKQAIIVNRCSGGFRVH